MFALFSTAWPQVCRNAGNRERISNEEADGSGRPRSHLGVSLLARFWPAGFVHFGECWARLCLPPPMTSLSLVSPRLCLLRQDGIPSVTLRDADMGGTRHPVHILFRGKCSRPHTLEVLTWCSSTLTLCHQTSSAINFLITNPYVLQKKKKP